MDSYKNTADLIKTEALRLGFSGCGISKVSRLEHDAVHLHNWLNKGFHADMQYMFRNADKRSNPELLVENAKSIISVVLNYYPHRLQNKDLPQISKYAYGKDYHHVMKNKLNKLFDYINSVCGKTSGRVFTDTAPILERAWAAKSGLGWIGKNTCLISKKYGSWIFIGELVLDIELDYDEPIKNYCGSCTKCIDACPTKAIVAPNVVDSNKCISYQTIENKNALPDSLKGKMNNYYFGCDICQNVCPWNKKPVSTDETDFQFRNGLLDLSLEELIAIDEKNLQQIIKDTSLERTKYKGIQRNLAFLK